MIVKRGFALAPPEFTELPTSDEEQARQLAESERHRKNIAWFNAHAEDIYRDHLGKHICVAGEELFVGMDPTSVYVEALTKHPNERGATFRWHIPTHSGPTIYTSLR